MGFILSKQQKQVQLLDIGNINTSIKYSEIKLTIDREKFSNKICNKCANICNSSYFNIYVNGKKFCQCFNCYKRSPIQCVAEYNRNNTITSYGSFIIRGLIANAFQCNKCNKYITPKYEKCDGDCIFLHQVPEFIGYFQGSDTYCFDCITDKPICKTCDMYILSKQCDKCFC